MSETLMPVDDARVLKETEILVLRSLQDAIKGIREDTAQIREQVYEVRERMIKVEAQETNAKVIALDARLDILERDKQRLEGAAGVVGFVTKNWQFLMMVGFVVYTLWARQLLGH